MARRMTIREAFDLVPADGVIVLRAPIVECLHEAERRNMRTRRERYSVAAVQIGAQMQVLITHKSVW